VSQLTEKVKELETLIQQKNEILANQFTKIVQNNFQMPEQPCDHEPIDFWQSHIGPAPCRKCGLVNYRI